MRSALIRTDRYTRVAVALHWIIAAAIVFNLWLGLGSNSLPADWKVMPVHKATGITILALTLVRIAWRLAHPAPPLPPSTKRWERMAAHASHFAFYGFMLAMPLTGWAMASGASGGRRRPLDWYGLFDLPYLPVSDRLAGVGHDLHVLLGWGLIALLLLHVVAALRHHFVLRDAVLARMVPGIVTPPGR